MPSNEKQWIAPYSTASVRIHNPVYGRRGRLSDHPKPYHRDGTYNPGHGQKQIPIIFYPFPGNIPALGRQVMELIQCFNREQDKDDQAQTFEQ